MANDVTIVVEASVGDALVKLDLAKHAVNDLGDEAEQTDAKMAATAASTGFFEGALASLNGVLGSSIPLLGGFSVPLIALPAVAGAAAVAIVALADVIGTLIAIVADFVAPITLVAGLLGSLGIGFAIAAKRAAEGGGPFKEFHKQLEGLHTQFDKVSTDLALRFLPYLERLATGASHALTFIDKLAHEPLDKAMHDMATRGVQMLNNFVNQIAATVARPIRLAFQIAFGAGPGGNEFASAVASWWNRLTHFLFGYTQTHQIHIGRFLGPLTTSQVDGIFQPVIDWFGRHHFAKQGIRIGHEILDGIKKSGLDKNLSTYFGAVFKDAFKTVGVSISNWNLQSLLEGPVTKAVNWIEKVFSDAWDNTRKQAVRDFTAVVGVATDAAGAIMRNIESKIGAAWAWVVSKAQSIWSTIVGIFSAPLHLNISVPSLPSLSSIVGSIGGAAGGLIPGVAKQIPSVQVNIHSPSLATPAQQRAVAGSVGDTIMRRWVQIAGVG